MGYCRTCQQSLNPSLFFLEELIIQELVALLQEVDGQLGKQVRSAKSLQGLNRSSVPIWVTVACPITSVSLFSLLQNGL